MLVRVRFLRNGRSVLASCKGKGPLDRMGNINEISSSVLIASWTIYEQYINNVFNNAPVNII